jgi:hypothetical protein
MIFQKKDDDEFIKNYDNFINFGLPNVDIRDKDIVAKINELGKRRKTIIS